jgi:dTDP-4-amino-4,6-dideoxygalactose transaminase
LNERPETPEIRFQRPSLPSTSHIDRYLDLSREERWFSNGGPCSRLLSERLADRVGAYCVPVANGTLGLMAAIASIFETARNSLGCSPALMPSFTFLATAQAVVWSGLEPRLMDVDPSHWHLDASRLEKVLHDRTDFGAVVAVSAFGTPPQAETRIRWEGACASAGLPLIVDSAAGFGGVADDETPVGSQGDVEVVSFHATKPFAIGEGGAVFTRKRALYERVELAVNFGLGPDRSVDLPVGLNAKMSELHAATALAVLDEFESILASRRRSATRIRAAAGPGITWQSGCELSTWQFVPVAFRDSQQREQVIRSCRDRVQTRTYYQPLHTMEPFRQTLVAGGDLSRTEDLHARLLCLPMANDLDDSELEILASLLRDP